MPISKPTHATGLVALIVVLLVALTALQYGWIGELSEFQRQQMERTLRSSTNRFVRDLDGELETLWYVFRFRRGRSPGEEIVEEYSEWAESFDFPGLVAEAYWVEDQSRSSGTDVIPSVRLGIERISLESGRFEKTEWPPWLTDIQRPIVESADSHRGRGLHDDDNFTVNLGDRGMVFVVAQTEIRSKSWAVVVMPRDVLVEQFLPALVRDHFGPDNEREFEVQVFDEADDGNPVFTSSPEFSSATTASPDLVRYLEDFGGFVRNSGGDRTLAVAVTHRAGSVTAAVAQLRGRNLGFSFGVVLVLGASIGVLAMAAQRARRLAERQMEFVAGVSHELRTPIAGISSLSQNLADGVVQDLAQAARYGETIHQESRRLGNMVESVLHYSAIRSGRYRYEMRNVDVRGLVDGALSALDPAELEKYDLTIDIDEELPPLFGDDTALQSAVRNLVSNAMKFSKEGDEIRLSAVMVEGPTNPEIELRVEDSGPGIEAAELSRVFEPFFRGRAARAQQVEGSGLGLSVVKEIVDAHEGRIEASSNPGDGTAFRVRLPTAGNEGDLR